jgi:Sel1 repeat
LIRKVLVEMRMNRLAHWARLAICVVVAAHYANVGAADAASVLRIAPSAAVDAPDEAAPVERAKGPVSPLEQMFDAGQRALLSKDYPTAYRLLRNAAEQGHASAQCALGDMYLAGQGVAADDAQAWIQFAASASFLSTLRPSRRHGGFANRPSREMRKRKLTS